MVLNRGYSSTCAMIMHTRADQLLSQLLMDSLDTLLSYYRHIGNSHEEVSGFALGNIFLSPPFSQI